jgi:stalled ribosome rescue protein Dom34
LAKKLEKQAERKAKKKAEKSSQKSRDPNKPRNKMTVKIKTIFIFHNFFNKLHTSSKLQYNAKSHTIEFLVTPKNIGSLFLSVLNEPR